jgi:DNA-binding CsgD family transcriptional regulator
MRKRQVENAEYGQFATRIIHGMYERASGDPDALPALRDIARSAESHMKMAVAALRSEGYSWADIGLRLGISRQAAQQHYGQAGDSAVKA